MDETVRKYFWSLLVTLLAAFGLAVLPFLGNLPMDKGAIFGLMFVGIRAGVKALVEAGFWQLKAAARKPVRASKLT